MNLANSGTHNIATAFTFGAAALVFATLPFLFMLLRGLYKANSGNQAHSNSIINVFAMAFGVHFVSCIFFMMGIKLLDVLNAIYSHNHLQDKIFKIFWTRGESEVFSLAGASGSVEDKGMFLQLYALQITTDWLLILMIWIVAITASTYGVLQYKKDVQNANLIDVSIWLIVSNITGILIFYLWAKIATLALFIPDGKDVVGKILELYKTLLQI